MRSYIIAGGCAAAFIAFAIILSLGAVTTKTKVKTVTVEHTVTKTKVKRVVVAGPGAARFAGTLASLVAFTHPVQGASQKCPPVKVPSACYVLVGPNWYIFAAFKK
jgi:hypothetical protein